MIDTICQFIGRLFPHLRRDDNVLCPDDTHKITIEELPNGNPRFTKDTLIGDKWYIMNTIEIEAGQRHFWDRVVEVIRCHTGEAIVMPDGLTASAAYGLPGAELLTQERVREQQVLPKRKMTAGQAHPEFTGTIKSTRKTKTRKGGEDDETDILTELEDKTNG